jgi:hypothetical protein
MLTTRLNPERRGKLRAGQPLYVRLAEREPADWADLDDMDDAEIETPEEALRAMGLPTHIRMLRDQPRAEGVIA